MNNPFVQFFESIGLFGVEALIVTVLLTSPLVIGAIFGGAFLLRRISKRRQERREREQKRALEVKKSNSENLSESLKKKSTVYYDRSKSQWIIENLPIGLTATVGQEKSEMIPLDACGISGLVKGVFDKNTGLTQFVLPIKEDKGTELSEFIRSNDLSASIVRQKDGQMTIVSEDASVILKLAQQAYPLRQMEAGKDVRHTREWIVTGCKTYEEAVQKLASMKDRPAPENEFTSVNYKIGDHSFSKDDGKSLKATLTELPSGAFIISQSESFGSTRPALVPANIKTKEELERFALDKLGDFKPESESEMKVATVDVTPEKAHRFVPYRDENGVERRFDIVRHSDENISRDNLKAFVILPDAKSFEDCIEGRVSLDSFTNVSIGTEAPDGKYVLELDVKDGKILSRIDVVEPLPMGVAEAAAQAGVSPEDLKLSRIEYEIAKDGYANSVLNSSFEVSEARVRGVPVSEIHQRRENDRLTPLDDKQLQSWIHDASRIESVELTVDTRKQEMRITSVIDGERKTDIRPMTKSEISRFEERGEISLSEKKDLLMQLHPNTFETYRAKRVNQYSDYQSTVKNPFQAFINGDKSILRSQETKKKDQKNISISRKPGGAGIGM